LDGFQDSASARSCRAYSQYSTPPCPFGWIVICSGGLHLRSTVASQWPSRWLRSGGRWRGGKPLVYDTPYPRPKPNVQ
jgi:hypothetical protein